MSVCRGGGGRGMHLGMRVTHIFCARADDFFNPQITSLIAVSRRPRKQGDRQTQTTIKLMKHLSHVSVFMASKGRVL